MSSETIVRLMGGKYELRHENGRNFRALRYGEPWRDLTGDGMVLALVQRVEELEEAATIKAAQGGVTEAMVERACNAYVLAGDPDTDDEPVSFVPARMRAALEAALPAEPAELTIDAQKAQWRIAYLENGQWSKLPDGLYRVKHWGVGYAELTPVKEPAERVPDVGAAAEVWHCAHCDISDIARNATDERIKRRAERVKSWMERNRPAAQPAERVPEVTFDMMREAEHLCPSDLPHLDKLRWKASKITRALSARTPYFDGADSPERKWFVITGTNRADTPILLFTSRALAEQYCRQNPHPDGYSIYAAYPAPSEGGKGVEA